MSDKTVECKYCKTQTTYTGTKLCDRCYELEKRISKDVDLAEKIMNEIKKESKND